MNSIGVEQVQQLALITVACTFDWCTEQVCLRCAHAINAELLVIYCNVQARAMMMTR